MPTLNRNNSNWSAEERRKINENWEILERESNSSSNSNNGLKQEVEALKLELTETEVRSRDALQIANQASFEAGSISGLANQANVVANDALNVANVASQKAESATLTSQQANTNAESVREQFNQIVAEAGSNNPEVVASRTDTVNGETFNSLPERLDRQNSFLNNRIREVEIRPEDFGAVGGGVIDDTLALQAAIDYAYENNGYVSLTTSYGFTNLRLPTACVIRARRRSSLRHIGSGIGIQSGASGNNLNSNLTGVNIFGNPNTTILLDLSGFALATLERCNIYGNGMNSGILVKCGRGDDKNKTGYYNTFIACFFNGDPGDATISDTIGVALVNNANSTRVNDCRFDYISNCIFGEADTNNNTFTSTAFEHFNTAIITSGRAYTALSCRFESPDNTVTIAMRLTGPAFFNTLFGCHFQNISNANKFLDESNSGSNYYILDNAANLPETNFNGNIVRGARILGLRSQTSYYANEDGSFIYYGNDNTGSQRGLTFNDRNVRKKVQLVNVSNNASLASQTAVQGEIFYNSTLNKPIFNNGTQFVELTRVFKGTGNPEGVVAGLVTDFYHDTTGNILYYKQSGTGNTGWKVVNLT